MTSYESELNLAVDAVREAASKYNIGARDAEVKENAMGIYDLVTSSDKDAESFIVSKIISTFPEDNIIGEEGVKTVLTDNRTWVIDPIDGTVNYTHNIPIYGTQVALLIDKQPVMSVIYLPNTDEMFTAIKGNGAYLNGKRITVSDTGNLKSCLISLGDYSRGSEEFRVNQSTLMSGIYDKVGRVKMMGAACYDFASFAAGRIDMHIRFVREPWDFMPGLLLASEAGGQYNQQLYDEHKLLVMSNNYDNLQNFVAVVADVLQWEINPTNRHIYEKGQFSNPSGDEGRRMLLDMNDHHKDVTEWMLAQIPNIKPANILDIGCGGGMLLNMLSEKYSVSKLTGLDISQESVNLTKEYNEKLVSEGRLSATIGSVSELPFEDTTFNLITAMETYFFWPDLRNDIKEIVRCMAPGAILAIGSEAYIDPAFAERNAYFHEVSGLILVENETMEEYMVENGLQVETITLPEKNWVVFIAKKP